MPKRLLNPDGTLNILRKDQKKFVFTDLYHFLLSLSWPRLIFIIIFVFFILHAFFATLYFFCGADGLHGIENNKGLAFFQECFFFSVQTLATIGYGHVAPKSFASNFLVTIESFLGLFGLALMTGLLFARFSRPTARVLFSKIALICNYQGQKAFLFRLANQRLNHIVEAQVSMVLVTDEQDPNGKFFRRVQDLKILRSYTPIFALSWTVVHFLNEKSPLKNFNLEELALRNAEIIVSVSGTDEIFSQRVYSRYSYTADEILVDRQFKDVIFPNEEWVEIDFSHFHEVE